MAPSPLLHLPKELRDQIWHLVYPAQTVGPFATQNREWFFYPARRRCHACGRIDSDSLPTCKEISSPLMACRQIYEEARPVYIDSITLHVTKVADLEDIRQSRRGALRHALKHLKITTHITEPSGQHWQRELRNLHITFPRLDTLDIYNHMRPPVSYQNLVDAIFLAAPIVQFPSSLPKPQLYFAYTEDDEMFSSDELGTIYYRDALEAHEDVIRDLIADDQFKIFAANSDIKFMTTRLLSIAQAHEQPWLDSIRQRRIREAEATTAAAS